MPFQIPETNKYSRLLEKNRRVCNNEEVKWFGNSFSHLNQGEEKIIAANKTNICKKKLRKARLNYTVR